jgi:hypothetical protein
LIFIINQFLGIQGHAHLATGANISLFPLIKGLLLPNTTYNHKKKQEYPLGLAEKYDSYKIECNCRRLHQLKIKKQRKLSII